MVNHKKMNSLLVVLSLIGCALSASLPAHPVHPVFAKWDKSSRIIGGAEAVPNSIPYQVALYLDGYFCGGSLISKRWVLTAAHCGELTNKPVVVLGAHEVDANEATQVEITGSRVIVNDGWDPETLENDISLIELPSDAPLNENIAVVPLASVNIGDLVGSAVTVSGWGLTTDHDQDISPVLKVLNTTIISNSDCEDQFGWEVYDSVVCIDGSQRTGTCNGDSGGPMTVRQNNQNVQVGLVSYGTSLGCEKRYPSALSRISSFRSWITQNSGV